MTVRILKEDDPERPGVRRSVSEDGSIVEESVARVRSGASPASSVSQAHAEALGVEPGERIGHSQRSNTIEVVETAVGAGYLDVEDAANRLTQIDYAMWGRELVDLVSDLPISLLQEVQTKRERSSKIALARRQVPGEVAGFFATNIVVWAVWFLTGHDVQNIWPLWVLLGTGIFLAGHLLKAAGVKDIDDEDDD